METWDIHLLGHPRATCGERSVSLRSRLTWATLASLLLQSRSEETEGWITREELLKRFWPDTETSRVSLRMVLSSLRTNFGHESIITEGDRVRIHKERFRLDIETIESAYTEVKECGSPSERISLLKKVERGIAGEFLEGCLDPEETPVRWISNQRAEWNSRCAIILLTLAHDLTTEGNSNAAFEAACRSVRYNPQKEEAWEFVWQIGRTLGRNSDVQALQSTLTFTKALHELKTHEHAKHSLSLREERIFETILQRHLQTLSAAQQRSVLALSVHPDKFHFALAHSVAPISPALIRRLVKMQILEPQGEFFVMPEPIRNTLWANLSSKERNRLLHRLKNVCTEWLNLYPNGDKEHFLSYAETESHFGKILQWQLETPPTVESIAFVHRVSEPLGGAGQEHKRTLALRHCEEALANEDLPQYTRYLAAYTGGTLALASRQFLQARRLFLMGLASIPVDTPLPNQVALHFMVAVACHHGELPEEALQYVRLATEIALEAGYVASTAHSLRFEGEILRSQGRFTEALIVQKEALLRGRSVCSPLEVAECLFQYGVTQRLLGNFGEAMKAQEEALEVRSAGAEYSGMADSLCEVAQLRAEQGNFLWACLSMNHARLLYEKAENAGGVAALLAGLGDMHHRQKKLEEAHNLWQESLEHWKEIGHKGWTEKLRTRIESEGVTAL